MVPPVGLMEAFLPCKSYFGVGESVYRRMLPINDGLSWMVKLQGMVDVFCVPIHLVLVF